MKKKEPEKKPLREMTEAERAEELRKIAEEIRNLPYIEDRVGQAFIMFSNGKRPK